MDVSIDVEIKISFNGAWVVRDSQCRLEEPIL
jgi:hypothetical protein